MINDVKLIREAFNEPLLTGRGKFEVNELLTGGFHGVINTDGAAWVEQRRFTLRFVTGNDSLSLSEGSEFT